MVHRGFGLPLTDHRWWGAVPPLPIGVTPSKSWHRNRSYRDAINQTLFQNKVSNWSTQLVPDKKLWPLSDTIDNCC